MAIERLDPFIGAWSVEARFPNAGPSGAAGETVFEWLSGERLLLQRWQVPHPDAPDGLAVIAFDAEKGTFLQHYFDSRGVVRLYEMSFEDGVWKLSRTAADFSPLAFAQRFIGTFSDDGNTIAGRWEVSDDASSWKLDFELTYARIGRP
jgi:hypothetical protein